MTPGCAANRACRRLWIGVENRVRRAFKHLPDRVHVRHQRL